MQRACRNHMPRRGYLLIAKGIIYMNIYPVRGFLSPTSFHLMPLMLTESPYGALYRVGTRIFLLIESPYGAMQPARYVLYALLWGEHSMWSVSCSLCAIHVI